MQGYWRARRRQALRSVEPHRPDDLRGLRGVRRRVRDRGRALRRALRGWRGSCPAPASAAARAASFFASAAAYLLLSNLDEKLFKELIALFNGFLAFISVFLAFV